jgi:putative restriction endonuclease
MDTAARNRRFLDADTFLRTDQSEFGNAWRYELVRGAIVAHAAPAPERGVILSNLAYELNSRLRSHPECSSEVGSGAAPQYEQRDTARIPDAVIRCGKLPHVLFEVVSPSELQHKRQRDQRRADLQAVEGVQEIVEIYHDEMLAHAYRRQAAGWVFESIASPDAQVALPSVGITVPLMALYERVLPEGE